MDPTADRPERIPAFVAAAVDAGVRRLVLLSAPLAGEETHPLHAAEQAVRESGLDWTILRPDWFAQNFSEGFWLPGILAGTLALPTGEGRTPFIDAEDIAAAAAAALTEDGHHGQIYQLTGSRAISFGEATDLIGKAAGRAIHYHDVTPETFTETQITHGVPRDLARLLANLLVAIRDGEATPVSDGVTRALGRPPRPFEDYVTEAAADGHWSPDA